MIPPPTSGPSQPSSGGVDCSTLDGVLDVSCIAGKCAVTKCQRGFDISPDGTDCIPQDHESTKPTRTMALPFGKADLTMSISIAATFFASQTAAVNQDQVQAVNANDGDELRAQPDVLYVPAHKLPTIPEPPSQISEDRLKTEINAESSAQTTGPILNAIAGEQTEVLEMDANLAMSMKAL